MSRRQLLDQSPPETAQDDGGELNAEAGRIARDDAPQPGLHQQLRVEAREMKRRDVQADPFPPMHRRHELTERRGAVTTHRARAPARRGFEQPLGDPERMPPKDRAVHLSIGIAQGPAEEAV